MMNNSLKGNIFNIQRFSINDGPGIRTSVFVKGCNLRCLWCHNPESQSFQQEIQYFEQKCVRCMKCIEVCPTGAHYINENDVKIFDRSKCDGCGLCVEACVYDALVFVAKHYSVDEVVEIVMKDADYYASSGGGLTVSGGEPMLQRDFVRALFAATRARGIHNALDTAANVAWEQIAEVLEVTDLVLLDLKAMDNEAHLRGTGTPNTRVLENALRIAESDVDIIVRIPVIPGINDSIENMDRTAEFVRDWPRLLRVELLPYHDLGVEKYTSLGLPSEPSIFETPAPEQMQRLAQRFSDRAISVAVS